MPAYVYSVNPRPVAMELGQFGIFVTPAQESGQKYTVLEIADSPIKKDLGEDRYETITINALDIAKDLVERYGRNGVSYGTTPTPSPESLAAANELFRKVCEATVLEADALWRRYDDPRLIDDRARYAVEFLGITKEWHTPGVDTNAVKECPKCAEVIKAKAVRCKHCGYEAAAPAPPSVQTTVVRATTGAGVNVK